ncbi:hypothetical protein K438DRAFT_2117210 [Mycena galopus ATCC 62051]|nr:hypothetical protein K438DRAFT_2117210 [Mycena galopus ATCC 62051]
MMHGSNLGHERIGLLFFLLLPIFGRMFALCAHMYVLMSISLRPPAKVITLLRPTGSLPSIYLLHFKMGSAHSSITPDAALTAVVVIGGAVAIGYFALSPSSSSSTASAPGGEPKKKIKTKSYCGIADTGLGVLKNKSKTKSKAKSKLAEAASPTLTPILSRSDSLSGVFNSTAHAEPASCSRSACVPPPAGAWEWHYSLPPACFLPPRRTTPPSCASCASSLAPTLGSTRPPSRRQQIHLRLLANARLDEDIGAALDALPAADAANAESAAQDEWERREMEMEMEERERERREWERERAEEDDGWGIVQGKNRGAGGWDGNRRDDHDVTH